MFCPISPSR